MAGDSSSETDAASMGSGCRETPPVASMTGGETGRQDVRRPRPRLPPVTVTRPPPVKPPPTVSVASRIRGLTERYNLKQSREIASKRNVSRERAAEEAAVSLGQRRVSVQFGEREFVGYFLPHDTLQVTPHDAATACPRVISPVPGPAWPQARFSVPCKVSVSQFGSRKGTVNSRWKITHTARAPGCHSSDVAMGKKGVLGHHLCSVSKDRPLLFIAYTIHKCVRFMIIYPSCKSYVIMLRPWVILEAYP
uniref:Uncharacterized protein LOC116950181 n=1 Tax=Petromyzon marinus TaxID=7757 RepID=A0AAJ7X865_PETMA|nr:uncharacterized protein LOC116950181 [Petromyzon marinus]